MRHLLPHFPVSPTPRWLSKQRPSSISPSPEANMNPQLKYSAEMSDRNHVVTMGTLQEGLQECFDNVSELAATQAVLNLSYVYVLRRF